MPNLEQMTCVFSVIIKYELCTWFETGHRQAHFSCIEYGMPENLLQPWLHKVFCILANPFFLQTLCTSDKNINGNIIIIFLDAALDLAFVDDSITDLCHTIDTKFIKNHHVHQQSSTPCQRVQNLDLFCSSATELSTLTQRRMNSTSLSSF